jgi:hypothetical protein
MKKYDAIQGIQPVVNNLESYEIEKSIDGNTFASNWSNCSNISFDRYIVHL